MPFPWRVPDANQSDTQTAHRSTAASPVTRRRALGLLGHHSVVTQPRGGAGRRALNFIHRFPEGRAGWPWSRPPPAGLHLSRSDRTGPVWGPAADLGLVRTGPGTGRDLAPAGAGWNGGHAGWERLACVSPSSLQTVDLPRPGAQGGFGGASGRV